MQPALSPLPSFVNIVVFVIDTPFGIETPDWATSYCQAW
jgi:hypothetical protein